MNNRTYQALLAKMATILAVLSVLFIATAQSTGFQIQDTVSQTDSMVNINIRDMVGTCRGQNEDYSPVIESFIFNFWEGQCYNLTSISDYPQLFNSILNSMRRCLHPCNLLFRYQLPDIPCTGQVYPNTFSINYDCGTAWQLPLIVETTSTVQSPTTTRLPETVAESDVTTMDFRSTGSRVSTRLRNTQRRWESTMPHTTTTKTTYSEPSVPGSTIAPEEHLLIAIEAAGYDGYLSADLTTVVCDDIGQLHVLSLEAEVDKNRPCQSTLSTTSVEDQLHEHRSLISQPNCTADDAERVRKLTIHYQCLDSTTLSDADKNRSVSPATNIGLILGIVIPIVVLMFVLISIATVIIYKRRNKIKVLLHSRSIAYDPDEGIYQDPNHAFNYSQMNSAYSTENLDNNSLYQDPTLILRPPRLTESKIKGHKTSVKSMDSYYQDPSSLPCTGPPGTPSPIRDALYSTHEDPSSDDIYTDPDGKLGSDDQNIYDMPCVVVTRNKDGSGKYPDEYPPENRFSQPSYTHMIVTDGQMEPHNYAIIRQSRPPTESLYYDLKNEVQLYDSPVYNSMEDVNEISDEEEMMNEEVF